ncbi:MAG: polysulfide reductase NrfD [Desulfosarcinaceae bacterium]|jgi:molybdopterin-containing oxidoreductase family membrane subunit
MNKTLKIGAFIIWIVLMLWGLSGVFQRLTTGHHLAHYGSYVPWGLWVAAKIFFVGLAVGASFLVWVTWAFNLQRLGPFVQAALWIAVAAMISGLMVIAFDLGHMWRLYEVFTRPNFSSLLAIASWLSMAYLIYLLLAIRAAGQGGKGDATRRGLGFFGIFFALLFSGANGAEFATLISTNYWHSALGPILSIAEALLSGMALVLALAALLPDEKSAPEPQSIKALSLTVVGLILFLALLEWSEFTVTLWYGQDDGFQSVLFGPYWYVFWIIHLLIGMAVPLALLLSRPAERLIAGWAALLAAVTMMAVRLNHVIPGQLTPAMDGLKQAYQDPRLRFEYFPSTNEWAVFAFSIAVCMALFYLGMRLWPLTPPHSANQGGN